MQRHYGIDLDHAKEQHSAVHVAALARHMPRGDSVLYEAIDSDAGWSRADILLAALVNNFMLLRYGLADKRTRGKQPALIGPSWMTNEKAKKLEARAMPASKLMEILSLPRTERR